MKYVVTLENKQYEIEVEQGEAVVLSESTIAVNAVPQTASAVSSSTSQASAPSGGEVVPSPLPGVVLKVCVSAGQQVKAGQLITVIEAMKMENDIVSPRDGVISQVLIVTGQTVEIDAPLVVLG